MIAPGICLGRNPYFLVSDLILCLELEGMKMPNFTKAEIELAHTATDLYYGSKFGEQFASNKKTIDTLNRLQKHLPEG